MIAVGIHQPLAITDQVALALQSFVEIGGEDRVPFGERGIKDFNAAAELNTKLLGSGANAILAADELRGAEALLHKTRRRSDYLLLFAFGENHALGLTPQPGEDLLQHAGDRIAPAQ